MNCRRRGIATNTSLTVDYVGSHGYHGFIGVDANEPVPTICPASPCPAMYPTVNASATPPVTVATGFPVGSPLAGAGKVSDERGEPVSCAQVMLFKAEKANSSHPVSPREQVQTNDIGEFRFVHLSAGKYFLAVDAHPWYAQVAFNYAHPEQNDPEKAPSPSSAALRRVKIF